MFFFGFRKYFRALVTTRIRLWVYTKIGNFGHKYGRREPTYSVRSIHPRNVSEQNKKKKTRPGPRFFFKHRFHRTLYAHVGKHVWVYNFYTNITEMCTWLWVEGNSKNTVGGTHTNETARACIAYTLVVHEYSNSSQSVWFFLRHTAVEVTYFTRHSAVVGAAVA